MAAESVTGEPPPPAAVDVSIVVPTYREAENLAILVPRIADAMAPTGLTYETIVVDDDSQDGTHTVLARLAGHGLPTRLITRVGERGLSSAVVRGFREARGAFLVCMDADLSHPPEALPRLLAALAEPGVEFVIGSRYVAGGSTDESWGLLRRLNSKVATLLARPFTSAKDPMAGFFALPRSVFERAAELNPVGYKIGLELLVKCRCSVVCEVPIPFSGRKFGQSKLSFMEQLQYLRHLKRLADFRYGVRWRIVQFCAVGASGMFVDLIIYTWLLRAGIPHWIARVPAIWVAMTSNYYLNCRVTFSYGREGSTLRHYRRFVASCTAGVLVSWAVSAGLPLLPPLTGRYYLAWFLGIVAGSLVNFFGSLLWVFRREASTALGDLATMSASGQHPGAASEITHSEKV